jgi:hypothetical protein
MKLKSKKTITIITSVVVLLLALLFTLNYISAKSVAKDRFENVESASFVDHSLMNPEVVVYTKNADFKVGDNKYCLVIANFVTLERSNISWKVKETSYKQIVTEGELSEEDRNTQCYENLENLKKDVEEENIKTGDNVDLAGNIQDTNNTIAEDEEPVQVDSSPTVELNGGPGERTISINGEELALEGNVGSIPVTTKDGRYLFYTKTIPAETEFEHSDDTGTLYRYDRGLGKEEVYYQFNEDAFMAMAVTDKYLVYTLDTGETGVFDLNTTAKNTQIVKLDMDGSTDPGNFVEVKNDYAVISYLDKNLSRKQVRLDLVNLKVEEI